MEGSGPAGKNKNISAWRKAGAAIFRLRVRVWRIFHARVVCSLRLRRGFYQTGFAFSDAAEKECLAQLITKYERVAPEGHPVTAGSLGCGDMGDEIVA